ncbi:hypothetical protein ABZZ01_28115 [Streptomyces virginiae]
MIYLRGELGRAERALAAAEEREAAAVRRQPAPESLLRGGWSAR